MRRPATECHENEGLRQLAEECGFKPRLCRPYRAKTKGKVERFNGYLKGGFLVPLAASLEAAGLKLTPELANAHVRRWLDDVANARVHATTKEVPATRLAEEQAVMLPAPALKARPALPCAWRSRLKACSTRWPCTTSFSELPHEPAAPTHSRPVRATEEMACLATEWPALAQQAARDEASFADLVEKLLHVRSLCDQAQTHST